MTAQPCCNVTGHALLPDGIYTVSPRHTKYHTPTLSDIYDSLDAEWTDSAGCTWMHPIMSHEAAMSGELPPCPTEAARTAHEWACLSHQIHHDLSMAASAAAAGNDRSVVQLLHDAAIDGAGGFSARQWAREAAARLLEQLT